MATVSMILWVVQLHATMQYYPSKPSYVVTVVSYKSEFIIALATSQSVFTELGIFLTEKKTMRSSQQNKEMLKGCEVK